MAKKSTGTITALFGCGSVTVHDGHTKPKRQPVVVVAVMHGDDQHWCAITKALADELDDHDPWATLGKLATKEGKGVLVSLCDKRAEVVRRLSLRGPHNIVDDMIVQGY